MMEEIIIHQEGFLMGNMVKAVSKIKGPTTELILYYLAGSAFLALSGEES